MDIEVRIVCGIADVNVEVWTIQETYKAKIGWDHECYPSRPFAYTELISQEPGIRLLKGVTDANGVIISRFAKFADTKVFIRAYKDGRLPTEIPATITDNGLILSLSMVQDQEIPE